MKTIVSAGSVIDKVLSACNRTNDSDTRTRLFRELATIYMRLCSSHPFEAFRRELAKESGDSNLLPSNVCGVRFVVDENGEVYSNKDAGIPTDGERFFTTNTVTTIPSSSGFPFTSDDCVINAGENTFESEALGLALALLMVPNGIAVTGTGVLNGTYVATGSLDGKPYFEYESGGVTGRFRYSSDLGAWIYAESSTGYTEKYGIVSEENLPPADGYLTIPAGGATDIALTYTEDSTVTAVGEFAVIGDNDELFEITAEAGNTFTLDHVYRGDSQTAGTIYVRPPIAQSISLYDQNDELVDDVDYTVYYWIIPPALHRSTDILLLPSSEALELLLLRATPEAKERRPVSQSEINEAIKTLKKMNPDNVPSRPAQHRFAQIGSMNTGLVYGGTRE